MRTRLARLLLSVASVCALSACIAPETKPPQNPVLASWAAQYGFEPWLMNGTEVYCRQQSYSGAESVIVPPMDCDRARTVERLMRSGKPPPHLAFNTVGGFW